MRCSFAFAAKLAQEALGVRLTARAAGLMDAERIGGLAARLELGFLADVATLIDVRAVGAFADRVGREVLVETIGALSGEGLLEVALLVERRSRLDEMLELLSDEQLRELLVAAEEDDLLAEALELLGDLDDRAVARVGRALGGLEEDRRERLAEKVREDADLRRAARRLIESAPESVRRAIESS